MKEKIITFLGIFVIGIIYILPIVGQTESKVAILTVSGSGKTQDEAKQNALRNAIEQAFGTFISSNTQILNDQLIKDEIVSVSNGNIQEFIILSEVQTSDGNWSNTIKAKVAIDKLTSFCESKGVKIEFKGALFALNIKQQELNIKNEEQAIKNMCTVLKKISENCFDYEIEAGEPSPSPGTDKIKTYDVPITIFVAPNNNMKLISDYFISTIKGLSVSESEIENYEKLGNKIYSFVLEEPDIQDATAIKPHEGKKDKKIKNQIEPIATKNTLQKISLRNIESIKSIEYFLMYFRKVLLNFEIITDIDSKLGNSFIFFKQDYFSCELRVGDSGFKPSYIQIGIPNRTKTIEASFISEYYLSNEVNLKPYLDFKKQYPNFQDNNSMDIVDNGISFKGIPIGEKVIYIKYRDRRTTDEISKISGYKIMHCQNRFQEKSVSEYDGGPRHNVYKAIKEGSEE